MQNNCIIKKLFSNFSSHSKIVLFVSNYKMSSKTPQENLCDIAVCQFTATNNKVENLNIAKKLILKAAQGFKVQMVFLPEACDFIAANKDEARTLAETLDGVIMTEYKEIAKINKIWLSIGGFHEKNDETTIFNSHVLINSEGEISSIYRKIHLFDVSIPEQNISLKESELTTGGRQILAPSITPAGPLALAICYDLRFPELGTLQRKLGASILTYPSAFTNATGQAHWEILLRARAIENQCYVVAAAQYGKHNEKRISFGQSMIVDPWGKILAECPKYSAESTTNESIAVAKIDLNALEKIRKEMPVLEHRRSDVYTLGLVENKLPINDEDIYKFANKNIPGSTVFYRSPYSFAFTNIRCVVPGHVLISSLRLVKRLEDLNEEELSDLFITAVKVQKCVELEHSAVSSTLCVQDGQFAGQTVPHIHVHILPRKEGDFDRNDDVYDCLAKHDREDNPQPLRDLNEQMKEAKTLRKFFY